VPLAQAVEMYRALRSQNVPAHLYVGPREGHLWSDPRHLVFKANVELEWFAKYTGGGAYAWEKIPAPASAKPGA